MNRLICGAAILLTCLLSFSARAENFENGLSSPWDNETQPQQHEEDDIVPMRLSLADLEKLTEGSPAGILTPATPSPIETLYSGRIIDDLTLYGYDLFQTNAPDKKETALPAGQVQDTYVLSAGDTLDIVIRGQVNVRDTYTVDTQGFLVVNDFMPVTAAGRTLKDVRDDLSRTAAGMHNTDIFVSLSGVRQVGVLVVGHIKTPGRQTLTAFHTVLDALQYAGGVEKTGSLRQIKLVRGGQTYFIDLYSVLMQGGGHADKLLMDGDRLIVPPIGATVAVSGAVKRPGIYEIRKGETLSMMEMLGLAGGVLTPGDNRFVKLELTQTGDETVQDITSGQARNFTDGSILSVAQAQAARKDEVTLKGETRRPGPHDLKKSATLSALIKDRKTLGEDIYPLIGMIERKDADQLTRHFIEFSPVQVLKGKFDRKLEDGDTVHLFSAQQIADISAKETGEDPAGLLKKISSQATPNIDDKLLVSFLNERAAFVRGAVRQPGAYPVADGTTLDSVLAVAGGATIEANKNNIEITSRQQGQAPQDKGRTGTLRLNVNLQSDDPRDIKIGPGDTVRVNTAFRRVEDQSVSLTGEVKNPGRYDLMPGDTMLSLLTRAGGVTEHGYPDGIIFSRASERKREESRYRAQAQDLQLKLAATLQQAPEDKKPDVAQITAVQSLITQLSGAQAVGRITVEADESILTSDPEQDILLEPGDRIYIPKRPLNVRVAGEVLSPASLQFRKSKSPGEYLDEAGGTTYYADRDRAFVVYPDGSAKPLSVSLWNHGDDFIPPGSTIIVPRDPQPFSFIEGAERVSQILANLAISGLYIEAIGSDDD